MVTNGDLAAAIIGAENSVIRDLRSEDLAFLLSWRQAFAALEAFFGRLIDISGQIR